LLDRLPTQGVIGGASLHRYITSDGPIVIRPTRSASVEVEVRPIWVATANLAAVDPEQARRTVCISIQRQRGRRYLTPDLHGWVRENRDLVLAVLCRLVLDWMSAGCAEPKTPLAGFSAWSRLVGGVAEHALGNPGLWLAPDSRPKPSVPEWRELAEVWPAEGGDRRWLMASEIRDLIDRFDLLNFNTEIESHSPRGRASRLGRLLKTCSRHGIEDEPDLKVRSRKGHRNKLYLLGGGEVEDPGDDPERIEEGARRAIEEMSEVGVRVDATAWDEAVSARRKELAGDRDGLEALDAYAGQVSRAASRGDCLLYTSPSPRDRTRSRMPSSA